MALVQSAKGSFFGFGAFFASATRDCFPMAATFPSTTSVKAALSALFVEGTAVAFVLFPTLEMFEPWMTIEFVNGKPEAF